MTDEITFPDESRSELEQTIADLVDRAQRVLATQNRLRSLLAANQAVVENLELPDVLRRIAQAATDLVGARYGALGVLDPAGGLEQFIHVGMPESEAEAIGHLPEGRGVLGAVFDLGESIRLEHISDDERSVGFPANHPQMDAFLGVPIRVRDEVFGNLYLTEPAAGRFTAEDEEVVAVLASTAAIAIENARLFDQTRRRQRWSAALAEVAAQMLSDDADDSLTLIVDRVAELTDSDLVWISVPADADSLRVAASRGEGAERIRGEVYPREGTLTGQALTTGEPVLVDRHDASPLPGWEHLGPAVVLPLRSREATIGALGVARRPGRQRFDESDLAMASEFAAQAGLAIELVRGRSERQRWELLEDRTRIARDLHDHVIQRLFGAGLALQRHAALAPEASRDDLMRQIDAIDTAISEIRTVVFALTSAGPSDASLRRRVLDVAREAGDALALTPRIAFSGPIDLLSDAETTDDVVAVVRESLSNVAKHASASSAEVDLRVADGRLSVVIDDDGIGYSPGSHRGGTDNLAERAARRGGEYGVGERPGGGTRVSWTIPIGAAP